ncbi:hypothetical protein A3K73_02350 [Candidatus Pacearchaeota archaeon RBG_13_36_9]|nr:MAG: hypothetical protein A3K73_02350 [Candidatus Pacearchaeota archaeon RBG_13_36_9]
MEEDDGLAIVAAADRAIRFQNKNPNATIEEAIGHAMDGGGTPDEASIVAIAAATEVFRFKERHRRAKDKEVLRFIIAKIPEIIKNMEVEA